MVEQEVPANLRLPDWEHRLFALIDANKNKPFSWGEFDCVQWGAMCLEVVTGKVSKDNAKKRKTQKAALRIVQSKGGLYGVVCSELGESISPKMAMRGDICLVKHDGGETIGVAAGSGVVCPSETGLVTIPMSKVIHAWHI